MGKLLIGAAVIVILGFSAYFFTRPSSTPQPLPPYDAIAAATSSPAPGLSSNYRKYTPEALTTAANQRRVLFFYANWCTTCRPADADLQKNSARIPSDVVVFRVNYNDPDTDAAEKDLAAKYKITYQHTYVQIDSAGTPVATWNGGSLDALLANLN